MYMLSLSFFYVGNYKRLYCSKPRTYDTCSDRNLSPHSQQGPLKPGRDTPTPCFWILSLNPLVRDVYVCGIIKENDKARRERKKKKKKTAATPV
jgi:hypothetical protein